MSNTTVDREGQTDYSARNNLLPISLIDPSPYNPRQHYDQRKLESLANDIRLRGVLQPIVVRPVGARYEIMAGERRFRACKLANETEIPATIRECGDMAALEIAIVENFQRADLNPIEQARGMQMLADRGLSQAQIGERVGKLQGDVSKALGLLRLPADVQECIAAGFLSATHGHYLCALTDHPEAIERLATSAMDNKWTTDQLKAEVDRARMEIEDARQPRMDVAPPAPAAAAAPSPQPAAPTPPGLVGNFLGNTPAQATSTPPAAAAAPPASVTSAPPALAAMPAPAPAAPPAPAPAEPSAPAAAMVSCLIPTVLDDWLFDQEMSVVEALEYLRRLQDATINAGCDPNLEALMTAIESGSVKF